MPPMSVSSANADTALDRPTAAPDDRLMDVQTVTLLYGVAALAAVAVVSALRSRGGKEEEEEWEEEEAEGDVDVEGEDNGTEGESLGTAPVSPPSQNPSGVVPSPPVQPAASSMDEAKPEGWQEWEE